MQLLSHSTNYQSVVIIGAGAWGTALAIPASQNAQQVYLYDRDSALINTISETHQNHKYLPGITLGKNISAINSAEQISESDLILVAVPTQAVRAVLENLKGYIPKQVPILICCKGIENDTHELMSNLSLKILPTNPIAVLSGPNFAIEVASNRIAATTVACTSENIAIKILNTLSTKFFRVYRTTDLIGVQVGGATKNVIAIAAGIIEGLKLGENAKAALITRGLSEITKLTVKLGGKLETMLGLSGIGDLVLTCNSTTSRNMSLGFKLANGEAIEEILRSSTTVEGYFTTLSIQQLSKKLSLDLPICHAIYQILYEKSDIKNEIEILLNRPTKAEFAI